MQKAQEGGEDRERLGEVAPERGVPWVKHQNSRIWCLDLWEEEEDQGLDLSTAHSVPVSSGACGRTRLLSPP